MADFVICGDIGGTNSRLALFEVPAGTAQAKESRIGDLHHLIHSHNYKNDKFSSFTEVVQKFIVDAHQENPEVKRITISTACFAVAGPVSDNVVRLTNRGEWNIAAKELESSFGIQEVRLVNDFVANGFGLLTLNTHEYETVQGGAHNSEAPIALVGAGTGLGECFLTYTGQRYEAFATEGGHVEFPPRNEVEIELLRYLQKKFGSSSKPARISTERIVSGKGIENTYDFFTKYAPDEVDERCNREIWDQDEPAKKISMMAYDYKLAQRTMELMMATYGAEAGNVALKYLPYGGLYIAGGIAPHNMQYIKGADSIFLRAFHDKGRVASILADVPIRVVKSEDLGLRGAHVVAVRMLVDRQSVTGQRAPARAGVSPGAPGHNRSTAGSPAATQSPTGIDMATMLVTATMASVMAVLASHWIIKRL
ncbi:uncharacterized protein MONBRDRAFT_34533 [Monosiga brevicollis MX1]|uniref:Glucokinase n=1 Tax=Monosiga brevicollis TaxID=81824 RepID=A9VCC7_MONBE|nr:uncharacterized protein MONBRDRAFT_34533 [Monosiga brevicollis MX1]EDQ84837.1 predicted protein [Monosiga brevicollis MX1]|eukprot:XP_001750338.1 hypothetical protein [Monosiga brevicollis MX1]